MEQSFPRVQLLAPGERLEADGGGVYIVLGSRRGVGLDELRQTLRDQGVARMTTAELDGERLRAYVAAGRQVVLTDGYAPVDNLLAGLFRSRG
jgi:hypothetical protein